MHVLEKIESFLQQINKFTLRIAYHLIIYLLAFMTLVVLVSVFFRYVLQDALSWTEEFSKFLMIWMTLMGSPIALQLGAHVGIDALPTSLKGRAHFLLLLLIQLIILALLTICVKEGIALTFLASRQTASSLDLSLGWIYLAMPLGATLMFLVAIQHLVFALRGIMDPSIKDKTDRIAKLSYRDFLM
jgi:TRAP-type C4-dicarboxylate transport system permease small subunit